MPEIKPICDACQKERDIFYNEKIQESPACLELFRLSIVGDRQAYDCFYRIFEKQVTSYVYRQVETSYCRLGLARVPEIVSDVFTGILRYSVNRTSNLTQTLDSEKKRPPIEQATDFAHVIGYIQGAIRRQVAGLCRKESNSIEAQSVSSDYLQEIGEDISSPNDDDSLIDQLTIRRFLEKHIQEKNDRKKEQQNRIIVEWGLLQDIPPREILEMAKEWFDSIADVYQATKRVQLRLLRDPEFSRLYSPRRNSTSVTSLQFRLDIDEVFMQEDQDLSNSCLLDEETLLDYVNGIALAEVKAAIESSPACLRAVAQLRDQLAFLRPHLRTLFCPDSDTLVAYQERKVADREVSRHVDHCRFCQQELRMLAEIDKTRVTPRSIVVGSDAKTTLSEMIRTVYQLIFQPATMAPVPMRGEGSYRTIERSPQIELLVKSTKTSGKQGNWMLLGRLRYEDDQPVTPVESIRIQDIEDEDAAELSTTVDESGRFTLKGLDAGTYRVRILMPEEEIVLHDFKIGDD